MLAEELCWQIGKPAAGGEREGRMSNRTCWLWLVVRIASWTVAWVLKHRASPLKHFTHNYAGFCLHRKIPAAGTVNRYGISFCNTCAEMFLIKVSIILKRKVEIPTSENKMR